ncbi:MAG: hypothetical protein B6244_14940 [Candidatus Cloacimonetes bacterium 4572_55]|nr:MAG: hypothetical protein B6244_14940 [Candidatus Cloacimonetes bacterium 4572_55]
MAYLTVIKDHKYTGIQYEQDTPAIRAHHAAQGETLIFLDRQIKPDDIPTEDELADIATPPRIIDGQKISGVTRSELANATTTEELQAVLVKILLGNTAPEGI